MMRINPKMIISPVPTCPINKSSIIIIFSPLSQPQKEKWFIKRKRETVYYLSMEILRNLCIQIKCIPMCVCEKTAVLFLHTMKIPPGCIDKAQRFIKIYPIFEITLI